LLLPLVEPEEVRLPPLPLLPELELRLGLVLEVWLPPVLKLLPLPELKMPPRPVAHLRSPSQILPILSVPFLSIL